MRGAKKYIAGKMGISTSSIPGAMLPAGVVEDTCPLCGKFQPLDDRGYCNTEECNLAIRQLARRIARAEGGNVSGLYYRFGDLEVINFTKLERWEEPKQVKHPDMCQEGECTDWALPGSWLCRHHKLAEKREEMLERSRGGSGKRRRTKNRKMHGNKIRGLDRIKLK